MTRSIDRNDELVNIGWKFATCNKIRDGEVKTDGSSDIFFFNDTEESTQLIRSDKSRERVNASLRMRSLK